MKKKVSIIGAEGYLGRHITQVFKNLDFELDLYNRSNFETFKTDVDFIFHLAGKTGTLDGFDNFREYIESNEMSLLTILEKVRKSTHRPKIIFPSSRLVYRGQKNTPLVEDATKEAKTIYAANKLACESYLKMYKDTFEINYSIARICVPYGNEFDDQYSYGTIGSLLTQASQMGEITLFGDGNQQRSLIHISDLANNLVKAAVNPKTDDLIFNLGGPESFSIKELAELIAQKYHAEVKSTPWPKEHLKIESGDTIFDSSLIESLISIDYQFSFQDWLKHI